MSTAVRLPCGHVVKVVCPRCPPSNNDDAKRSEASTSSSLQPMRAALLDKIRLLLREPVFPIPAEKHLLSVRLL